MLERQRRGALIVWTLLAVVNLSAALVIASRPERQSDLESMRRWGAQWLLSGVNVYGIGQGTDYPPNAIVTLSPLGALPSRLAIPLWAGFNLVLALVAPYLAVRAVRPAAPRRDTLFLVTMFVCWGGFRTLLQFSLLTLTLGLLAMVLVEKRPGWSGVCLGLGLAKPQVAVPFLLWALFTRRLRVAAIAVTVAAAGFAVFCLRAHARPPDVVRDYVTTLRTYYAGHAIMTGLSDLRPLVVLAVANVTVADTIAVAVGFVMLGTVCVLGYRERRGGNTVMYSAPALAALWSLLTFYHVSYGFIVLLPAAVLLIAADDPRTLSFRTGIFWVLQVGLMIDVPGVWRRTGQQVNAPEAIDFLFVNFDRWFMLSLFVCLVALSLTTLRPDAAQGRSSNGPHGVR